MFEELFGRLKSSLKGEIFLDNNEPKFVSLVSDTTFKYLWKNERTNSWIREIVESKTGLNLSDYHLSDNEMNTGSDVKDYRTDITLSNNKDNVIIEMNNDYYDSAEIKGRQYLFRKAGFSFDSSEKYNEIRTCTLIMFNNYLKKGFEEQAIINSWFGAHELGIKYEDIEMFEIFLPIFNKVCYHRSNEIDKRLRLFSCNSYDEMYSIVDKDDPNYFIIEELRRLGMNNKFVDEYDYEFVQKKLMNSIKDEGYENGKQDGKMERNIEIAKKSLEQGLDINIISTITGLSIDEINELKV